MKIIKQLAQLMCTTMEPKSVTRSGFHWRVNRVHTS